MNWGMGSLVTIGGGGGGKGWPGFVVYPRYMYVVSGRVGVRGFKPYLIASYCRVLDNV